MKEEWKEVMPHFEGSHVTRNYAHDSRKGAEPHKGDVKLQGENQAQPKFGQPDKL